MNAALSSAGTSMLTARSLPSKENNIPPFKTGISVRTPVSAQISETWRRVIPRRKDPMDFPGTISKMGFVFLSEAPAIAPAIIPHAWSRLPI
jgi:hypothetical protein